MKKIRIYEYILIKINEWLNGEGKSLPYRRILANKYGRNYGIRKSRMDAATGV